MTYNINNNNNKLLYPTEFSINETMYTFLNEPTLLVPHNDDTALSVCSSSSSTTMTPSPSFQHHDYQVWQSPCPSDYLGFPTFENETTASATDMKLYSSSYPSNNNNNNNHNDFCVSDLLDPHQQTSFITSPAMTHHSMLDTSSSSLSISQQHLSPLSSQYSDYWVSPLTPSMDSMDYNHNQNNHNNVMMMTPYLYNSPSSPCLSSTSSPLLTTNHNNNMMTFEQLTPPLMSATTTTTTTTTSTKKKVKKIHHCPHCHHTSNRANNMKEHILTHDPNRPKLFSCHVCSKSFARKHDMKRHTKSHSKLSRKSMKRSTS